MRYIRSKIRRLLDWMGEQLEIDLEDLGDDDCEPYTCYTCECCKPRP